MVENAFGNIGHQGLSSATIEKFSSGLGFGFRVSSPAELVPRGHLWKARSAPARGFANWKGRAERRFFSFPPSRVPLFWNTPPSLPADPSHFPTDVSSRTTAPFNDHVRE